MPTKTAKQAERLLEPQEVADRLNISRPTADRLMDSGQLKSINIGSPGTRKYRRTTEAWLREFIASRAGSAGA